VKPAYVPADAVQVFEHERMRVWREQHVQHTKLYGDIDDTYSVWWRSTLDTLHKERGFTPFMTLDVCDAAAVNSMAMRLKSAAWARELLKNLREGLIFNGNNATSGFVIRAILRVAGMPNVFTVGSEADMNVALLSWRAGRKAR
jgi:hypothetical protein